MTSESLYAVALQRNGREFSPTSLQQSPIFYLKALFYCMKTHSKQTDNYFILFYSDSIHGRTLQCSVLITGTRDRYIITQKGDAFKIPADVLIMPKMYRALKNNYLSKSIHFSSVADLDPSDSYVLGHPGSGSISQRLGGTDPAPAPDPSIIKQKK